MPPEKKNATLIVGPDVGYMSIIALGEALIDFVPKVVDGETVFQPRCGGAPFNVCLTVARLQYVTSASGLTRSGASLPFGLCPCI